MTTALPTTGRISRRQAIDFLMSAQSIAHSFEDSDLMEKISWTREQVDSGIIDAPDLRALSNEINSRVWDRLAYSATLPATITPTTTVTLYAPHSPADAAAFAAEILSTTSDNLRTIDVSTIQTPTTTGTRYTFRTAQDVPSSQLPA
jgi:hypothetical protein